MELQTAMEILEYHQQWRLGKREDMIYEPKKLTEALDVVISKVKNFSKEEVERMYDNEADGIVFCGKCGARKIGGI